MPKLPRLFVVAWALLAVAPRPASADDPGYALKFDGTSDFVRLASTSSIMGPSWATTKTVGVWVKPTGTAACTAADVSACDAIFGDRPRSWGISRGTIGGQDRIWVWNYDGTMDRIGVEYTGGEWIQVTLVHDAGVLKAYKNGILAGSVASGTTISSQGVLHVGGIINSASRNWTFEGEIDEVRLWSVARTEGDILADLYTTLAGGESGLVAYYKMSDGSGTSLTDDSIFAWTGTLNDGASGVPGDGPIQWVPSGAFNGGGGPINTPPVADPQELAGLEDTALPVTLTGSDGDNEALTFRVVTQPTRGTISGAAPEIVYTPLPNLTGVDSFTFVANDGHVDSAPATVTVTILGTNDPPVAVADAMTTPLDTAIVVAVLANDSDPDGDTLTVVDAGAATNGFVSFDAGTVTYTPAAGFSGGDTFTYTVSDGNGEVAIGQVTVTTLQGGNDPGWALRFDGTSDYVKLAPTSSLMAHDWRTTKTVSLWVRPTGDGSCLIGGPAACDAIFGDRPRWWGISRGPLNGVDRIWVWNWDGTAKSIGIEYVPGEWIHVALVHADGVLSAYRNGVLVGSVASGPTQQPTTGAQPVLQLGGVINNTSRNWTFPGEIDEVQIWNVARTAEEIASDMMVPLAGTETGLAAYYRMTDGSGVLLTDDSGHGWTGQLQDGGQGVPSDGPIQWVPSGAFVVGF